MSVIWGEVCASFICFSAHKPYKSRCFNLYSDYSPGGCPSGPFTVPSNDSYTYTLNSEDYVIERVNIQTSGHHSSDDNPSQKRTITQFEYIFR